MFHGVNGMNRGKVGESRWDPCAEISDINRLDLCQPVAENEKSNQVGADFRP